MRNKLTDELAVCGYNAVKALAEVHPKNINRLFLREDRLPDFSGLCKKLAERKRPYKICLDEELERVCKSSHHQGVAAMIYNPEVAPAAEDDIEAWAAGGKTCLLLCDVGNDHNLGAIIRSAAFFDAAAAVLTEGTELSTSAYRVAEGGMEHILFRRVRNPAAFLRAAGRRLVTVGADPRARIRIRDLPPLVREKSADGKRAGVILALGNEETGLPEDVKENCSLLARIPGAGVIESLNVSQAASLFLHELYEM
ncbi:MAG: RNA methyltransferase [Treponema sp.]|jgi:TrmH RNA methyltransferase|nr:RNA methyltransferase [Treponema sp.]